MLDFLPVGILIEFRRVRRMVALAAGKGGLRARVAFGGKDMCLAGPVTVLTLHPREMRTETPRHIATRPEADAVASNTLAVLRFLFVVQRQHRVRVGGVFPLLILLQVATLTRGRTDEVGLCQQLASPFFLGGEVFLHRPLIDLPKRRTRIVIGTIEPRNLCDPEKFGQRLRRACVVVRNVFLVFVKNFTKISLDRVGQHGPAPQYALSCQRYHVYLPGANAEYEALWLKFFLMGDGCVVGARVRHDDRVKTHRLHDGLQVLL